MTDVCTNPEETMTIRVSLFDKLLEQERAHAFENGKRSADRIELFDDYGIVSAVVIWHEKSRRALSKRVKDFYWRSCGDNPGQAFMGTAELLRARKCGDQWLGIVIVSTHYDV